MFGTLIALFRDDHPIVGIIDQPVTGERWIGAEGRATIFHGPFGGVAGCRPCPVLSDAELSCTSVEMLGPDMPRWERLRAAVRRNYWGGDCYAHGLVALGQIDIIAKSDMKVWDWGPLVPVIEGAGGIRDRLARQRIAASRRRPRVVSRRQNAAAGDPAGT